MERYHNVCAPISTLSHVWNYMDNLPGWVDRIVELMPRSSTVVKNVKNDCHVEEKEFGPQLRLDCHLVPRTLICHDMKGGYLEDK